MRTVILLIDSFGIGAMEDAQEYGDRGANTLLHICKTVKGEKWPNLKKLGLGNATTLLGYTAPGLDPEPSPEAFYAVMEEHSPGKDTTTGHWELMGLELESPFHYFQKDYPSFPDDLIASFLKKTGVKAILGNYAASGTNIIEELGEEHQETGYPILYTSADSVLQIACHSDVTPLDELYRYCEIARELCNPLKVGRVIARPFTGKPGNYQRTVDRKDYSIPLPEKTLFDLLLEKGVETIAVGKTGSIFNEQGFASSYHDKGNQSCLDRTVKLLNDKTKKDQLIFVNLVDTDMIYGHRRDPEGYYQAVDQIDSRLKQVMELLHQGDQMIITADHGCDPCYKGTDHTREHVPLLLYKKGSKTGKSLGIRKSFADMAASLYELYGGTDSIKGTSFAEELLH